MQQRLSPGNPFLWIDEEPERLAKVRTGEMLVTPVGANPKKAPAGLIHDWLGAAFIPNVTLSDVLGVVRDYGRYKDRYQPAVVESRVIESGETKDRYSTVLLNKSVILKTALDADYESCYFRLDDGRAYSTSRATRIQEIDDYGTPSQHMLPEDEGKGIIWRLFSITRYVERDGGVYLEFEMIGLTRDIPASLRWIVDPIVRRISRSSLLISMRQTERAARVRAQLANNDGSSSHGPSGGSNTSRLTRR